MSVRRIPVLQHHRAEGPGRIAAWARERGIGLETLFTEHAASPEPGDGFDALVLLGGPHSAIAAPDWLCAERAAVGRWLASGKPMLGICLGAQILAQALGAEVRALPRPETGWTDVRFDDGRTRAFLQWHDDAFDLPRGARGRAASADCACQMFDHGPHRIGLQFHPEWDAAQVATLVEAFGSACPLPRVDDPARQHEAARWLDALLDDWAAA